LRNYTDIFFAWTVFAPDTNRGIQIVVIEINPSLDNALRLFESIFLKLAK
jgi:hypothetical protein